MRPGRTERMRVVLRAVAFVTVCLAAGAGGCSQPYVSEYRLDQGLVLVFTGIEGRSWLNEDICHGLNAGGVDWAIELVDWTSRVPGSYVVNLRSRARNLRKAGEVARRIVEYRRDHPGRPVVLVGQSGGAAVAVWSAEALPAEEKVDGIVLLAPALSPGYGLDEALRKSRRGIVNFHSRRDWVFLGAGTTLTGTMDGRHGSAAGREGFERPAEGLRAELYERKLFQIEWGEQMYPAGFGGHLTSGHKHFVASHVAPLCLAPTWQERTMEWVLSGQGFRDPGGAPEPSEGP